MENERPRTTSLVEIIRKLEEESLEAETLQAVLLQALREIEPLRDLATRAEFYHLAASVEALAKAQERTEQRFGELGEAARRTEERLEKLAARMEEVSAVQKRTEESLLKLTHRVHIVENRREGISNSVGYSLENEAFKALPALLLDRHGIAVQGRLVRRYVGERQVNIFGRAQRDGQDVVLIGQCKDRPSRKEVDRFLKITQGLADQLGWEHPIRLFVAHDFSPMVEESLRARDVLVFWSYEF